MINKKTIIGLAVQPYAERFFLLGNSLIGRTITDSEIYAVSDLKSEGRCSKERNKRDYYKKN